MSKIRDSKGFQPNCNVEEDLMSNLQKMSSLAEMKLLHKVAKMVRNFYFKEKKGSVQRFLRAFITKRIYLRPGLNGGFEVGQKSPLKLKGEI